MDLKNIFEYTLPKIQIDVEKIELEINKTTGGYINIKNVGGSILKGTVFSNIDCVVIHQEDFEGNDISLEYQLVSSFYKSGEFIKSEIVVLSNGGEVVIPIFIKIYNFDYLLCNYQKIFTPKQFYEYYLQNPKEAVRVFNSFEFMIWLKNINFQHIEIIEEFLKDFNKQRGIDNFFITAGVKQKATFDLEEITYKYRFSDNSEEDILGEVPLSFVGKGYFESDVLIDCDCDWLCIEKDKIFSRDFDETGRLNFKFKIVKSKLNLSFQKVKILFKKIEKSVTIEVSKKPQLQIILDKEYFVISDKGVLRVINNFGKDLMIEILPNDTFVKFEAEKYLIGKYTEIKFHIKLTGFLKAQMDFIKKPYISTTICIKTILGDRAFKTNKTIFIGNNLT